MRGGYNVFLLVCAIKGLTFKLDGHKHPSKSLHNSRWIFYQYYQTGQTTNPQYLETLYNKVLVIESYGGYIGTDPGLSNGELAGVVKPTDPDKQAADEAAKSKYLGVAMICGADWGR